MAHGEARERKRMGNWLMEWVASALTLPQNMVYPALLKLMRTTRLPAVDWTDAPADLNGLVPFGERRNLVSAHVPSHFKRTILNFIITSIDIYRHTQHTLLLPLIIWKLVSTPNMGHITTKFTFYTTPEHGPYSWWQLVTK